MGVYFTNTSYAQEQPTQVETEVIQYIETPIKEKPAPTTKELVAQAFGEDSIMNKIAFCESELRQYSDDGSVLRGWQNPKDVGIFQINEKYHLETSIRLGFDIYTKEGNIAYAKHLYNKNGTKDWSASAYCWKG